MLSACGENTTLHQQNSHPEVHGSRIYSLTEDGATSRVGR